MKISEKARTVLARLQGRGYSAYVVGGCVRDTLLGRTPGDWDICTSALPEETRACFAGMRVVDTGIRHGTVTVLVDGEPFEITTFRRDGAYADHRRPDQVEYVKELGDDLSRRDFTINAMATDAGGEVVDLFGGRADLARRRIRCVGDPDLRFQEDALRILRAMRFASQLEFEVEEKTAAAMERNRDLLACVSGERIYAELTKLLVGPGAARVLGRFGTVLAAVLPEIAPTMGFDQKNPCHNKDVWCHTLEALRHAGPDPEVCWALLLHDLGKPDCLSVDEAGVGHFHGHPKRSEALSREIFARLHADRATTENVCTLVLHHDDGIPVNRTQARRWIGRLGPELLYRLMEVKRCDCLAHADMPKTRARYDAVLAFDDLIGQVLAEESCFTRKDLKITGRDVTAAGVKPGPRVGEILDALLDDVLEERCANTAEALLSRLRERYLEPREKGNPDAD